MSKQPSFAQFLPVALMVAVVAAAAVYLSVNVFSPSFPWAGSVWVIFISWAMYFMAGAKVSRIPKYIAGLTGGVLFGWLTIVVNTAVFAPIFGDLGLVVTVFFAALAILLLELTSLFELAPAYFFAFAAYFGFLGTGAGGEASILIQGVYVEVLLMAGIVLGYIVATLRTKIMNAERVPLETRGTIFDKEI